MEISFWERRHSNEEQNFGEKKINIMREKSYNLIKKILRWTPFKKKSGIMGVIYAQVHHDCRLHHHHHHHHDPHQGEEKPCGEQARKTEHL